MFLRKRFDGNVVTIAFGIALSWIFPSYLSAQISCKHPVQQQVNETSRGKHGSPYISLDSWIYVDTLRLHELGYMPTFFSGMRPYTRVSLAHAAFALQAEHPMR